MITGSLEITLTREKKPATLEIRLHPGGFGLDVPVTLDDLTSLANYCRSEAARWRADITSVSALQPSQGGER